MLGHSSKSMRSGKIYRGGGEPEVLDVSALTTEELKSHLRNKLTNPKVDGFR